MQLEESQQLLGTLTVLAFLAVRKHVVWHELRMDATTCNTTGTNLTLGSVARGAS